MHRLRRLFLPSLLILGLASVGAVAQTITKALQLSQDATGAFGVDTYNNVYFPGHILSVNRGSVQPTVAGTGTPTISGTDTSGTITMGSSATTAVVTFGRAYVSAPNCVLSPQNAFTTTNIAYTTVTTSLSLTQNSTSGNKISYFCSGQS
jgi:hypothetical protein